MTDQHDAGVSRESSAGSRNAKRDLQAAGIGLLVGLVIGAIAGYAAGLWVFML